jgi:hypothetical protein
MAQVLQKRVKAARNHRLAACSVSNLCFQNLFKSQSAKWELLSN